MRRSERPYRKTQEHRLLFLFFFFTLLTVILVARLFVIQVVKAKDLKEEASKQFNRSVYLPARRGQIFDCNGLPLAITIELEDVRATPYLVEKPEKVANKLGEILKVPPKKIFSKLNRKIRINGREKKAGDALIAFRLDKRITKKIKEIKKKDRDFKDIYFVPNYLRFYPYGELAASSLGVVGYEPTFAKGLGLYYKPKAWEGLELYYDRYLAGKSGEMSFEKTPKKLPIPVGQQKIVEPIDGYSIITTFDRQIQYQAEQSLKNALKKFKAKRAGAIVMNPKTGEILAMANIPSFDANHFKKFSYEERKNWLLTDIYEPGSTMKVAVIAAALEEKKFKPNSRLYLPAKLKLGKYTIGEAHHRPAGSYTVETILVKSYNIGSSLIAKSLGKDRVYEYYRALGFGQKTGIDYPGEAKGNLPPPEKWSASTIYTISYGQGIGATPLQMLLLFSTIANQGIKVKPHFLKKIVDESGRVIKEYKLELGEKVLTTKTSNELKYILEKVTVEGTGKEAAVKGYRVAGKTGTALKPKPGGGYMKGAYIASFVGFAPVRDPEVAIIVVIDEPKNGYYGGVAAAPVFREIMEFSLRRLKIPPN